MNTLMKLFTFYLLYLTSFSSCRVAVAAEQSRLNSLPVPPSEAARAIQGLDLVEALPPKLGEPQTDVHAAAIVALGKKAGPLLVAKILDDRESKCVDLFHYKIGDIAHALLCAIYGQDPSLSLMARNPPVDPGHGYYYRDYLALVASRKGREELKTAWGTIIETATAKQISLEAFKTAVQELKAHQFKSELQAQDIASLKRTASAFSELVDSWSAILQLWLVGERDFVELLWWQKDDTETRTFIVSLDWCMVALPEKDSELWPASVHNYERMAIKFEPRERMLRTREADFVRQNHQKLALELSVILSESHVRIAERYKVVAEQPAGSEKPQ